MKSNSCNIRIIGAFDFNRENAISMLKKGGYKRYRIGNRKAQEIQYLFANSDIEYIRLNVYRNDNSIYFIDSEGLYMIDFEYLDTGDFECIILEEYMFSEYITDGSSIYNINSSYNNANICFYNNKIIISDVTIKF